MSETPVPLQRDGAFLHAISFEILDALPSHIAVINRGGEIVFVNAAWRQFASGNGYAGKTLWVGESYLQTCRASESAAPVARSLERVLSGELQSFELEYPCHSPDAQRWFRLMISPVRTSGWDGAVVMHINITERVLAEEARRQSERLQRVMLETTVDGILATRPDGSIEACNAAAARMFGSSRDNLMGRNITAFIPLDWAPTTAPKETMARRLDGMPFPVDIAVSDFHGEEGALRIGAIRDITQRKMLETQEKSEMVALHRMGRARELRQVQPAEFAVCAAQYAKILDRALEARVLKIEEDLTGQLRDLAGKLSELQAGPRDVIAIHLETLDAKAKQVTAARFQGYLQEGRLLSLELMGNLTAIYRELAATRSGSGGALTP